MNAMRQTSPSTARNREPISAVLRSVLPHSGVVLEIASGAGEHAVHFAKAFPHLTFQPSDPSPAALDSIAAWLAHEKLPNVRAPLFLDAASTDWPVTQADALICINMIHISPWASCEGLMAGAARILPAGAPLFLYGPYKRNGAHTAPSNEAFDADLKRRNPAWGIRDLEAVSALAQAQGFGAPDITQMPANNLSVVFRRL